MTTILSSDKYENAMLLATWMDRIRAPSVESLQWYKDLLNGNILDDEMFSHENERDIARFESEYMDWLVMNQLLPMDRYTARFTMNRDEFTGYKQTDILADFISVPCLRAARKTLNAYEIPIPLQGLWNDVRRPRMKVGGKRKSKPNMNEKTELADSFLNLDALHDLRGSNSVNLLQTAKKLLDNVKFIPDDVKATICTKGNVWKATYMIIPYLTGTTKAATHQETMGKGKLEAKCDDALWKLWSEWRREERLEVVMDGICTHDTKNETEQIYLQAAFLLMLFSNAMKIESTLRKSSITAPQKSKLKEICLMDGTFMRIESMCLPDFLSKFITVIKNISKINGNVKVVEITDTSYDAKLFKKYMRLNGIDVDMKQNRMSIDGQTLPYHLPMNKDVFKHLCCQVAETATDKELRKLLLLNFYKDAIKCEIAIQKKTAYITNDHIAFLWYCLLCRWTNTKRNGFCFSVRNNDTLFTV